MRLALFLDHKKHPLKRADVTAKVLPGHKGSQLTSHLIAEVSGPLSPLFSSPSLSLSLTLTAC
jgi:hypothetical protein